MKINSKNPHIAPPVSSSDLTSPQPTRCRSSRRESLYHEHSGVLEGERGHRHVTSAPCDWWWSDILAEALLFDWMTTGSACPGHVTVKHWPLPYYTALRLTCSLFRLGSAIARLFRHEHPASSAAPGAEGRSGGEGRAPHIGPTGRGVGAMETSRVCGARVLEQERSRDPQSSVRVRIPCELRVSA